MKTTICRERGAIHLVGFFFALIAILAILMIMSARGENSELRTEIGKLQDDVKDLQVEMKVIKLKLGI